MTSHPGRVPSLLVLLRRAAAKARRWLALPPESDDEVWDRQF